VWAIAKQKALKRWTALQMRRTELTRVHLLMVLVLDVFETEITPDNYQNLLRMNNKYIEELLT
jgi:hypothetical protein